MRYRRYIFFASLCLSGISGYANVPGIPDADTTLPASTLQATTSGNVVDYSGFYKWGNIVQMYEYNYDSTVKNFHVTNPLSIASDLNSQFAVVAIVKDNSSSDSDVIIKYLYNLKDKEGTSKIKNSVNFLRYNFNGDTSEFNHLSPQAKISRDFGHNQKYFLVKLSIFKAHALKVPNKVRISGALGFGILNYPFKYRPQKGMQDFSGSFNVGAAVSYTLGHDSSSKWNKSFVGGFGISSITLDKASVNADTAALNSTNGLTALTLSLGFMLEYNKIQVGVFMGIDRISNLNNSNFGWKFQGNPWFSIGLGYSIFSTSNSSSKSSTSDTQP